MPESTVRRSLIWLVDDSPTELAIMERALGTAYTYEHFTDGSSVIERLASNAGTPDMVIVDWIMPGVPGVDVCKYIRAQTRFDDIPIIIVTASRLGTSDVVNGLELGANDYVARPFAPEELRARVTALLRAKELASAASREQRRLATVNLLGRALFQAELTFEGVLDQLANALLATLCDGCSVLLLPGPVPAVSISRHRNDPTGALLSAISTVADPAVHGFTTTADAKAKLPPTYHAYIDRFGLRGIAIFPFPMRAPVQGVVTVTRDRYAEPFHPSDIATIETCIEYAGLAAESALRFDTERVGRMQLDAVLRALPIGIVAASESGKLTLVNDAASQLLPGSREADDVESLFRTPSWSTTDDQVSDPAELLFRRRDPGGISRTELSLANPGSSNRAIFASVVPLRDRQDIEVGTVTMLQDVTAERMIDAERERTARFQQEVLGVVGHDLRNPLSAIMTGLELLSMSIGESPTAHSVVKRLLTSTRRMERIIDQLLDVTRSRLGGGIELARRPGSLSKLAASVLDEQRLAYPKLRFELQGPDNIEGAWDLDRIAQVLANLLSNAAQYGRVEEPIVLQLAADDKVATVAVRNSVRDRPISRELIARLFDPFRRGTGGERNGRGLGLGLYIAHEIARSHGGTLTATSDEQFTTFVLQLPR